MDNEEAKKIATKLTNEQLAAIEECNRIKIEHAKLLEQQKQVSFGQQDQEFNEMWSEIAKEGKGLFSGPQSGYDSWVSGMSTALAIDQKIIEGILKHPNPLFERMRHNLSTKLGQAKDDKLGYDFTLEVDSQNKLCLKNLKRHDGKPITKEDKETVMACCVLQKMCQGYKPDEQRSGVMVDDTGNDLTREKFLMLQKDDSPNQFVAKFIAELSENFKPNAQPDESNSASSLRP